VHEINQYRQAALQERMQKKLEHDIPQHQYTGRKTDHKSLCHITKQLTYSSKTNSIVNIRQKFLTGDPNRSDSRLLNLLRHSNSAPFSMAALI
jgi:hypothetical protein